MIVHPGIVETVGVGLGHGVEEIGILAVGHLVFANPVFISHGTVAGGVGVIPSVANCGIFDGDSSAAGQQRDEITEQAELARGEW